MYRLQASLMNVPMGTLGNNSYANLQKDEDRSVTLRLILYLKDLVTSGRSTA